MEVDNHYNITELPQSQNVNYLHSADGSSYSIKCAAGQRLVIDNRGNAHCIKVAGADGAVQETVRKCPDGYYYSTDARGRGHCYKQPF